MERSPSSGSTFSELLSPSEAAEKLRAVSRSSTLASIVKVLAEKAKIYIVGGTVRDIISRHEECDIDLACSLPPETVKLQLEKAGIKVFDAGIKHGTVTAVVNGDNIEITTFRKPGLREHFEFSESIEEDLAGRDFTINAIAYDILNHKLLDPYDGYADLGSKIVRAVNDADTRLAEDPLRILRMVRFGDAHLRSVETLTFCAAKNLVSKLRDISIERIRMELEKILLAPAAGRALRVLREIGAIQLIMPEFIPSFDLEQNKFHTEDVFEHTLTVLDNAPLTLRMRLAALFHDIGKPHSLSVDDAGNRHFYNHEEIGYQITKEVMKRLRFSNEEIHAVSELVRLHMRPLDCGPAGVRRLMRDLGEYFDDWKKLKIADAPPTVPQAEFEERYQRFETMVEDEIERAKKSGGNALEIDGYDLIEIGVKPGPFLGSILKTLENEIIEDPQRNSREYLLARSKELMKS